MLSSAFIYSALLLPIALGQNTTSGSASSSNTTSSTTTPSKGTSTTNFDAPTVTGTACGTSQQNFNQCVTKVSKDINSCAGDDVCLCQTYANIAACYNACPDLPEGATYKQQSDQHCAQAHISPKASLYNITSPPIASSVAATPTQISSGGNIAPVATASAFARAASAADSTFKLSSGLVGFAVSLSAIFIA